MRIVLADEISPDCCRLWDIETQNKLDKDRFRRDMGGLVEAYQEVARRLGLHVDNPMRTRSGPRAGALEIGSRRGRMKARITITLKPGVLDPQGKAIAGALHALGFGSVRQRAPGQIYRGRGGRDRPGRARAEVERMCEQLLANTIIENYAYELDAAWKPSGASSPLREVSPGGAEARPSPPAIRDARAAGESLGDA